MLLVPAALLALLWAAPAASTLSTSIIVSISQNDPFRAIAAHTTPKTELPICCLQPTSLWDSLEDEVLLSFEDWKRIQESAREEAINHSTQANGGGFRHNTSGTGNESVILSPYVTGQEDPSESEESPKPQLTEIMPPHFRVPLLDRFNYANLDCSARVHLSHRSAKSASSVLSSKRDRYMLSPCESLNQEKHFIIVELCEDIMIDTVQLANFEFFSGVFKDFQVSVAKTYTTTAEGWTSAGTYRAKNVRGVQVLLIYSNNS